MARVKGAIMSHGAVNPSDHDEATESTAAVTAQIVDALCTEDGRRALIQAMTLEEKASLMSGGDFWNTKPIQRLGIPSFMLTDGPHGLRKQVGATDHVGLNDSVPATCFPTAAGLANSWDADLLYEVGRALGEEARAEGVSVLLGPGVNMKRNPLGGRNFEYFSEDPLLAGTLAAALVRGIQSQGVAACLKHYAVNSQEYRRMMIDEVVDERALHEIYLEAFRIAVAQGRPWAVMTAYNRVNGEYANENRHLVKDILRERWGFDGLVVTDWGGNNDRVSGLRVGNALEMPSTGGVTDAEIVDAVRGKSLDEDLLNHRVDELLELMGRTAQSNPTLADLSEVEADLNGHHDLAVRAAEEAIVLLKNADLGDGTRALPLGPGTRLAVIGDFADKPRIQGAGSSLVNPTQSQSPREALAKTALDLVGYARGFKRKGATSPKLRREAVDLALTAERTVLFIGLDESLESEGIDRPHMSIPRGQLALLRDLLEAGVDPVVVLVGGSPMELPFADHVSAIVAAYLPGQGGAEALARILTGEVNPSGHLAETDPLRYEDVPSSETFGKSEAASYHHESIFVGYRYYDRTGSEVRFPFGHGLSYTTFEFTDLDVSPTKATVTVTNTGERAGSEVVQVYSAPLQDPTFAAPQVLAGFRRVDLDAGESERVEVAFSEHAFSVFDTATDAWRTWPGDYEVRVGASSRDIRLRATLPVAGEPFALSHVADLLPDYFAGTVKDVPDEEFSALIGRQAPPKEWDRSGPVAVTDSISSLEGRGGIAGFVGGTVTGAARGLRRAGKLSAANVLEISADLPFRSLSRLTQNAISEDAVEAVLEIFNGNLREGLSDLRASGKTAED